MILLPLKQLHWEPLRILPKRVYVDLCKILVRDLQSPQRSPPYPTATWTAFTNVMNQKCLKCKETCVISL